MYKSLPGGHLCYLRFSRPYFIVLKTIHVSPSTTHQAPLAFWKHALETFGSSPHIAIAWILHSPASRSLSWKSFNAISGSFIIPHGESTIDEYIIQLFLKTSHRLFLMLHQVWWPMEKENWNGGWFWASLSSIPVKFYQAKRLVESLSVSFGSVTSVSSVDHSTSFKRNASDHLLKFLDSGGSLATNKLPKSLCQSPFRSDEHFQPIFGWLDFFLPPTKPLVGLHTSESTQSLKSPSDMPSLLRSASSKSFAAFSCGVWGSAWSWRYHQVGTNGWNTRNFIDKLPFTKNHDLPEINDLDTFGCRFSIQHLPFLWSHQLWASLVLNTRPSMPERYRSLPIHVPSRRYWGDHHSWYPTRGRWLGLVPCVEIPKEPRLLQKYSPSLGVPKS